MVLDWWKKYPSVFKEDDFEAYLSYEKDNYISRVNATNLLALEKGLLQHIQEVQTTLEYQYSIDDQRTVREVLEDEKKEA